VVARGAGADAVGFGAGFDAGFGLVCANATVLQSAETARSCMIDRREFRILKSPIGIRN
jgi:hypothetical protein